MGKREGKEEGEGREENKSASRPGGGEHLASTGGSNPTSTPLKTLGNFSHQPRFISIRSPRRLYDLVLPGGWTSVSLFTLVDDSLLIISECVILFLLYRVLPYGRKKINTSKLQTHEQRHHCSFTKSSCDFELSVERNYMVQYC